MRGGGVAGEVDGRGKEVILFGPLWGGDGLLLAGRGCCHHLFLPPFPPLRSFVSAVDTGVIVRTFNIKFYSFSFRVLDEGRP